jgi:hypothetical protein
MMRDIKFRCWRDGYMCSYWPNWRFVENGLYWEEKDADPDKIGEGKPVLLQFTGRYDKNGKEIYEGDVLGYENNKSSTYTSVVRWDEQFASFTSGDNTPFNWKLNIVIGNIYENPELLNTEGEIK